MPLLDINLGEREQTVMERDTLCRTELVLPTVFGLKASSHWYYFMFYPTC